MSKSDGPSKARIPWIKMRKNLPEDRRVNAIALKLRISLDAVLGKLFRLWAWGDSEANGEDVDGLTLGWVNAKVEQSGFAEMLVEIGWLATTATGFRLVNFAEHNWQVGKEKALAAKRQEEHRAGLSRPERDTTVTGPLGNRHPPTPTPINTPLTPQGGEAGGRKGRRKKAGDAPAPPFPPALDTPAFRAAWEAWARHRKQKRAPLTAETVRRQFAKLEAIGPVRAIACIEHTIEKGWTGLFEPDDPPAGKDAEPAADLFTPVPSVADAMAEYERRRKDAK